MGRASYPPTLERIGDPQFATAVKYRIAVSAILNSATQGGNERRTEMYSATDVMEDGMVSAEYAVGTVATTGIAGLLVWLARQDWLREGLAAIFKSIFGF